LGFPITTLVDGLKVQTRTISTHLFNIRAYDALKAKDSLVDEDFEQMATLVQQVMMTRVFHFNSNANWLTGFSMEALSWSMKDMLDSQLTWLYLATMRK
jgi:hypothetical protein